MGKGTKSWGEGRSGSRGPAALRRNKVIGCVEPSRLCKGVNSVHMEARLQYERLSSSGENAKWMASPMNKPLLYEPILYLYVLPKVRVLCVKFYGGGGQHIISCGLPQSLAFGYLGNLPLGVMNFSFMGGCTQNCSVAGDFGLEAAEDVLAEVVRVLGKGDRHRFA